MADADDLELDSEGNPGSAQAQTVRKHISLKLKGKGRGRKSNRIRKGTKKSNFALCARDDDDEGESEDQGDDDASGKKYLDEDITKLETPTFPTLGRGPPEPLHQNKKLRWDLKVNLIGEKVINPMIHCCEKCVLPILIYGRMIPCKHVFCLDCAKKADKVCPRCNEKVQREEQSALGTVFMCTFGGTRQGTGGCRRTYLSQRDLQAHINHRHLRPTAATPTTTVSVATVQAQVPPVSVTSTASVPHPGTHLTSSRDPRSHGNHLSVDNVHSTAAVHSAQSHLHPHVHRETTEPSCSPVLGPMTHSTPPPRPYVHSVQTSYPSPIPVVNSRSNLITVPIQDDNTSPAAPHPPQQYPGPGSANVHQTVTMSQHTYPPPPPHHYPALMPTPVPAPSYSQPSSVTYSPALTTQSFTQPPPPTHLPPPPIRNPAPALFPNPPPPPPPVHHNPPPVYNNPPLPIPPQRFVSSSSYEENPNYGQPWTAGGVPPPRGPLPPRPMAGNPSLRMPQPHGPNDPNFRPSSYYQ